jgi:tetratricopeptide (TPR) repeat protein
MSVYYCPLCASSIEGDQTKCSHCHVDLSQYRNAFYAPDALYNEAVDSLKLKEYDVACEKLGQAAYLRPNDEEIFRLLADAMELSGNIMGALRVTAELSSFCDKPYVASNMERLELLLKEMKKPFSLIMREVLLKQSEALEKISISLKIISSEITGE